MSTLPLVSAAQNFINELDKANKTQIKEVMKYYVGRSYDLSIDQRERHMAKDMTKTLRRQVKEFS